MVKQYLYITDSLASNTSGRVTFSENKITVNMFGLAYDSVKVLSAGIRNDIQLDYPTLRLESGPGYTTDLLPAVACLLNDLSQPSTGFFISKTTDPGVTFNNLNNKQNIVFCLVDNDTIAVDIADVDDLYILLEIE